MKYCPKCNADVEGLLYRCDCCGASLDTRKYLFSSVLYELPQCLGFSILAFNMLEAIEPENPEIYSDFLEKISFTIVCYPESLLVAGNVKNRVRYSPGNKEASITVIVDYKQFVPADKPVKAKMVADVIISGLYMLKSRGEKYHFSIDDIVEKAEKTVYNPQSIKTIREWME